jgi:hypothetical protein
MNFLLLSNDEKTILVLRTDLLLSIVLFIFHKVDVNLSNLPS